MLHKRKQRQTWQNYADTEESLYWITDVHLEFYTKSRHLLKMSLKWRCSCIQKLKENTTSRTILWKTLRSLCDVKIFIFIW